MASNVVIAFDLDDTLYKERDYVLNAYLKILQRYAGEVCRASENCDFGEFAKNEDVISLCQNFLAHEKPYEAFDYLAAHLPGTDVEEMKAIYRSGDIPLKDTEGAHDMLAYLKDKGITVNGADPGIVSTNIIRMDMWFDWLTDLFFRPCIRTPRQGADTAIRLLLDEDKAGMTGRLFASNKAKRLKPKFTDRSLTVGLWEATEQWLAPFL